ncbi:putative Cys-rich domain containing protein [Histomonas meleagridis]|uniref:putative Cys-rich domain containing protein n=1 Tax=Histomonas meleagridis TaxID=135588 RepID=UPI00355A1BEF|nr:putative Cys-rich domain containing protein [Histomonas meleagridis]KAH0804224.1 putative Cys-rich domain containing protein [Histomonas meleagridis]
MSWKYGNGLFGCFKDIKTCLYGTFCTLCLHSKNVSKNRGEDCSICHCLNVQPEWYLRKDLGDKAGNIATDSIDCLISVFCLPCAVCQDASKV